MLLCVSCATISEFASLRRYEFSHLNDGNFDRRAAAYHRRTVAVPSYVRFEGLPLHEQQENLNHWYCDRCLAVYRKSIEGGGGAECSPPSKTDKLIELVRKSGVEEAVKQQQQHGMMQHSHQQLANRSEVKKHDGHRWSTASPGLKECLVNVFQRLTLESGAKSRKAKAEPPILRRQSFNAIRQRREEPPPVHGINAAGRKFSPTKATAAVSITGVKGNRQEQGVQSAKNEMRWN